MSLQLPPQFQSFGPVIVAIAGPWSRYGSISSTAHAWCPKIDAYVATQVAPAAGAARK